MKILNLKILLPQSTMTELHVNGLNMFGHYRDLGCEPLLRYLIN